MTVRLNQSEYDNKPIFQVYTATGTEIIHVEIRREYNKAIFRGIKNGGSIKRFGGHNLTYCTSKHTYRLRNGEMYDEDLGVRLFSDASIYSPISVSKNFSPSVNIDGAGGGIEMYEYKVVLNGTVLYDYVPVKEKSTGYLGFYDRVNKTFTTLVQTQYLQYYSAGLLGD